MKFAIKPIQHDPPHLRYVATLPGEIKNSNFCRYSADMEENANKLYFKSTYFNSSMRITVFWVYLSVFFIKILSLSLNTMLIVDKHCMTSAVTNFRCHKLIAKVNKWKNSDMENFTCNQYGEQVVILKSKNIKKLWMSNDVRGDKYAICLHFLTHLLNICRKFEFLISQGSVATYLRWDG